MFIKTETKSSLKNRWHEQCVPLDKMTGEIILMVVRNLESVGYARQAEIQEKEGRQYVVFQQKRSVKPATTTSKAARKASLCSKMARNRNKDSAT